MTQPVDLILPMLREMRAETLALHEKSQKHATTIEKRLMKIEEALGSFRHALTADTLMSKLITGEFEERIEALEKKMRQMERAK